MMNQFIKRNEHTWWFDMVMIAIQAWIWAFMIMFLGYLTLSFFGLVNSPPTHEVPGIPLIPPFNDSEYLGRLGEIGVPTTQPTPVP